MTQDSRPTSTTLAKADSSPTAERTRQLVAASLVTAVMVATGWISIPVGAVPVTLQVFGVVLAALLLTPGWAAAALAVYVLLGAAGIPVFANAHSGLGVVLGPTGGYLTGFIAGAYLGSLTRVRLSGLGAPDIVADIAASAAVIAAIYAVGWVQLATVLHLTALQAFLAGVAPFLVPDAIKAAAAIVIATAVRRAIERV
jgi:biotin transport system substrate-specific component